MYRFTTNVILYCSVSLVLMGQTRCNQYDPHLYPSQGPFFEGWYIRLLDFSRAQTYGVLFGRVLPVDTQTSTHIYPFADSSEGIVSILHREGPKGTPLVAHNAMLTHGQIHVSVNGGQPVVRNPDYRSPADFTWRADTVGFLRVFPDSAEFNFTVGDWRFRAVLGSPVPWSSNGLGPEGYLAFLPLPLHWFVYSLRSPLIQYELTNTKTNVTISGRNGVAHMEKNWGKSFPKAWIWAQGTTEEGVTLAITSGVVTFNLIPVSVPAHLIGYRNPSKSIELNFKPTDSLVTLDHEGCLGRVRITINSVWYKVDVNITADPGTFSDCLYGPEPQGFRRSCVESFDGEAVIVIKNRWGSRVLDRQVIPNAALEFGGNYVCRERCRQ